MVYHDAAGNENDLAAGHVQVFNIAKDTVFTLLNPYHDEIVNFLQVWITNEASCTSDITSPVEVQLEECINQMNTIISHQQFTISIGKFESRKEGIYRVKNERNGIFAFVIDGQMEIQYRLLLPRDGLSLWEQDETE